jgi:hypothetical protein
LARVRRDRNEKKIRMQKSSWGDDYKKIKRNILGQKNNISKANKIGGCGLAFTTAVDEPEAGLAIAPVRSGQVRARRKQTTRASQAFIDVCMRLKKLIRLILQTHTHTHTHTHVLAYI